MIPLCMALGYRSVIFRNKPDRVDCLIISLARFFGTENHAKLLFEFPLGGTKKTVRYTG